MRIVTSILTFLMIAAFSLSSTVSGGTTKDNTLSKKEKKAGWKLLFDGKTSAGWIHAFRIIASWFITGTLR